MVFTGEMAVLRQKPVLLPLYRPKMSHGLNLGPTTKLNLYYKKSYGLCLTENTLCFHYIHQTAHVGEMMVVYFGNSRPHKHAARAKLQDFGVQSGGTHSYHCELKG
jgi:hypothetical protein